MIFFSVGLPSRFTEWCDGVLTRLAARSLGASVSLISGNTLNEIGLAAIKSGNDFLVVGARQPAEDLRAALTGSKSPILVALDDPSLALANLLWGHGLDLVSATRATASSCAAMIGYAALPGALVLQASKNATAAAQAIAEHFGLGLSVTEIAESLEQVPEHPGGCADDPWQALSSLDDSAREMARGAIQAYSESYSGTGLGEIVWTRELFFLGDDPHQPASGVIELAGGVRNLLFGPYIALPSGAWLTTVTLAVSQEAVGMAFSIEVLAGASCACLAQTTIVPNQQGMCRATLAFNVDAWTEQPIALRVANLRPASGGRLALGQVALNAQAETRSQIPAEMAAALGY